MGQMYPLPTCGSKVIITVEWTAEVADGTFWKWFNTCNQAVAGFGQEHSCRHWNGHLQLSFFSLTFGIDEIRFLMKPAQG